MHITCASIIVSRGLESIAAGVSTLRESHRDVVEG